MAHTILDNEGSPIRGDQTISIMKYRKDIKDIREMDESSKPLFSLANGDTDIITPLTKIKDLDPETPIAFTVEKEQSDDYSYSVGWSPLIRAGDLAKEVAKLPLKYCATLYIAAGEEDVVTGYTNKEIVGLAKAAQQ
jgi:hypothetical protein